MLITAVSVDPPQFVRLNAELKLMSCHHNNADELVSRRLVSVLSEFKVELSTVYAQL